MATGDGTAPQLRFGPFQFECATGELYRDGQQVRLQEQPRQILQALLEHPGDLVTREQLRERLWEADTFVDFDHGLNTAIKKVRQALGDTAENPQFVETLARRGYRFIAPVSPLQRDRPASGLDAGVESVPPAAGPFGIPSSAWTRRLPLTLLLLALIGAAVSVARMPTKPSADRPRPAAQLAVIPLRVLPGHGAPAYLGVGIADAITTRLANVRQIALRPTSAVLSYEDSVADPRAVASQLAVEHLLLGTIQAGDDTYRISLQLVRRDGVAVWGRTYDLPRADLLRLQDDVAEQVVSALRVELTPPERARFAVRQTQNPAAYEAYLRGRALLVNYTEASMRQAIEQFESALAIEPGYARARAALATACAWFSVRYAYESDASIWGKRAEDEARRALEQDPSLADAHLAIANAAGTQYRGFDWSAVLAESTTALDLDPSLELAHVARLRALYHVGRFDEARREAQRARALNPASSVETARLEVALDLFAGDFRGAADRAAALMQRTDAPAVRHYLGLARYYLGDVAGAREMLASARRGGQPDVRSQASLASIDAARGLVREARERAMAIERGPYMDHHVAYSLGAAWAQLGDADASLRWLEKAADTGFPCYPWFARDTLLDPLRGEPRFEALLTRIEARHRSTSTH